MEEDFLFHIDPFVLGVPPWLQHIYPARPRAHILQVQGRDPSPARPRAPIFQAQGRGLIAIMAGRQRPQNLADNNDRQPDSCLSDQIATLCNSLSQLSHVFHPLVENAEGLQRFQRNQVHDALDDLATLAVNVKDAADQASLRSAPQRKCPLVTQIPPPPVIPADHLPPARDYKLPDFSGAGNNVASSCMSFLTEVMAVARTANLTHDLIKDLISRHTTGSAKETVLYSLRCNHNLQDMVRALEIDYMNLVAPDQARIQVNAATRKTGETIAQLRARISNLAFMATRQLPEQATREAELAEANFIRCLGPETHAILQERIKTRRLTGAPDFTLSAMANEATTIEEASTATKSTTAQVNFVVNDPYSQQRSSTSNEPAWVSKVTNKMDNFSALVAQVSQEVPRAKSPYPGREGSVRYYPQRDRDRPFNGYRPRSRSGGRQWGNNRQPRSQSREYPRRALPTQSQERERWEENRLRQHDNRNDDRPRDFNQQRPSSPWNDRRQGDRWQDDQRDNRRSEERRQGDQRQDERRRSRSFGRFPSRDRNGQATQDRRRSMSRDGPRWDPRKLNVNNGECLKCAEPGHQAFDSSRDECRFKYYPCQEVPCPQCNRGGHLQSHCFREKAGNA